MRAIQLSLEDEGSPATTSQSSLDRQITPDNNESSSAYQNNPTTKRASEDNN